MAPLIRMVLVGVLAFCPILAYSTITSAQSKGFYISGGAGANFTNDSDISGTGINTTADFDNGWAGLGAFGYRYGNGMRGEIELGYRKNDVDSLSGATGASGDVGTWNLSINGIYDINTKTKWTPYVGAGIGFARVNVDGTSPVGSSRVDDSDTVPAIQGIVGVSYQLNDTTELYGDYRYFATSDPDLRTDSGVDVDAEYSNHTVMVGLRWSFGGPKATESMARPIPAAVRPMPQPKPVAKPKPPQVTAKAEPAKLQKKAVARNYIVFFDWDRSNLTTEALEIVRAAAADAVSGSVTHLRLTGHADRSGPVRYNMALSKKRALSVKAELVRRGVKAGDIAIFAKGEGQPLVATGDGIREPQNRRVEIVFE